MTFTPRLATINRQRFQALHTTHRALSEDRAEAHYQPLVHLGSGEVVGVEALFRVRAPHGNIIAANELAPAMQAPRTAPHVTDRMLELVARDLRRWGDRGIRLEHVGLNLSRADLDRDDLFQRIVDSFSREGVPLGQIVLEITETSYLGDDGGRIVEAIERLRAAGLRVALDDFGTGFASLTHLLRFPVDMIKADRSLVDRLGAGGGGPILRGLVEMAQGLGMTLLAEGVETQAQAAELAGLGCRLGQGYLFGKPMSAAALEKLLQDPALPHPPHRG